MLRAFLIFVIITACSPVFAGYFQVASFENASYEQIEQHYRYLARSGIETLIYTNGHWKKVIVKLPAKDYCDLLGLECVRINPLDFLKQGFHLEGRVKADDLNEIKEISFAPSQIKIKGEEPLEVSRAEVKGKTAFIKIYNCRNGLFLDRITAPEKSIVKYLEIKKSGKDLVLLLRLKRKASVFAYKEGNSLRLIVTEKDFVLSPLKDKLKDVIDTSDIGASVALHTIPFAFGYVLAHSVENKFSKIVLSKGISYAIGKLSKKLLGKHLLKP